MSDTKLADSIIKRIDLVKGTDDYDELREHLCPFFEKGGHPDCITCKKDEASIDECRDVYLDRIRLVPMDLWTPEFDKLIQLKRTIAKIPLKEVSGIGISCNSCYMYDKCPLYQKDYECGIDWGEEAPSTPEGYYDMMLQVQYERVKRASVFEKIDGGVPDANLSSELDRLNGLVASKVDIGREKFSLSVEASGPSGGGGILAQIFGKKEALSTPAPPMEISEKATKSAEDVPFEEVKREPRKSKRT